ncbi:MAG: hypothetical protein U0791_26690 [Gemmataceae bacterium]
MNGELNAIAKQVAELSEQVDAAGRAIESAKNRRDSLMKELGDLNAKLLNRVGPNIRKRMFVVGSKVVTVEFEKGVTVQEIDRD